MGSTRLPGKILAPLAGRSMLALLAERLRSAPVDEWWLATTEGPEDDVAEAWGFELGLRVFRGATEDVLSRFVAIGRETDAEWIVRVTGDNPFLDGGCLRALLDARDQSPGAKQADLLRLQGGLVVEDATRPLERPRISPQLPLGYGVELVRTEALARAANAIDPSEPHHRAHVTSWIAACGRALALPTPLDWPHRPDWRWTVDTYEDLAMARSAFRLFGDRATTIEYRDMVTTLDAQPAISGMNTHVQQKQLEAG